jgi:O-antigen ligase
MGPDITSASITLTPARRPVRWPPESHEAEVRRAALACSAPAIAVTREDDVPDEVPDDASEDVPDSTWDALMLCVAGYILTSVGRVHQLFTALEPLHPAVVVGTLAAVLYAFDQRRQRRLNHLSGPTTTFLLALLLWMVLSVPNALSAGNSFDLIFGNFIKTAAMYFVTAAAVRGIRDVERLMLVYLLAAATYATVVVARFDVGTGDDWRLGHLYYYDANDFATFAVTAAPFAVYLLHAARRPVTRLLAVGALAVLTLALVRSGSRGGFLALAAVGGFIVLRYSGIPLRWRVSATALVVLVLLGTASDQYWQQMGTIVSDEDYNRTGETGRLQIWSRGVGYMLQHPILGVGPNNFPTAEGTISPLAERQQFGIGVRWSAAHNSLIQVGAEVGVPGLVLFIGMIASGFGALRRSGRSQSVLADPRENRSELALALTASLIGFVVGSFFLSLAYSEMLYTLLALIVGLNKVTGWFPTDGRVS